MDVNIGGPARSPSVPSSAPVVDEARCCIELILAPAACRGGSRSTAAGWSTSPSSGVRHTSFLAADGWSTYWRLGQGKRSERVEDVVTLEQEIEVRVDGITEGKGLSLSLAVAEPCHTGRTHPAKVPARGQEGAEASGELWPWRKAPQAARRSGGSTPSSLVRGRLRERTAAPPSVISAPADLALVPAGGPLARSSGCRRRRRLLRRRIGAQPGVVRRSVAGAEAELVGIFTRRACRRAHLAPPRLTTASGFVSESMPDVASLSVGVGLAGRADGDARAGGGDPRTSSSTPFSRGMLNEAPRGQLPAGRRRRCDTERLHHQGVHDLLCKGVAEHVELGLDILWPYSSAARRLAPTRWMLMR